MGDPYVSGEDGMGTGSSEDPNGNGKDKGRVEPKYKGTVENGFVMIDQELLFRIYKRAKDRRLPDGGVVDGGLMV